MWVYFLALVFKSSIYCWSLKLSYFWIILIKIFEFHKNVYKITWLPILKLSNTKSLDIFDVFQFRCYITISYFRFLIFIICTSLFWRFQAILKSFIQRFECLFGSWEYLICWIWLIWPFFFLNTWKLELLNLIGRYWSFPILSYRLIILILN